MMQGVDYSNFTVSSNNMMSSTLKFTKKRPNGSAAFNRPSDTQKREDRLFSSSTKNNGGQNS